MDGKKAGVAGLESLSSLQRQRNGEVATSGVDRKVLIGFDLAVGRDRGA